MSALPRTKPLTRGLTTEELAIYRSEGLVIPGYRLPEDTIDAMADALEELLVATRGTPPESIICPHVVGLNGLPDAIANKWLRFCSDPMILDMVQSVLGPDVILWGSQVFCKPAATGLEVPWHQDGEYWPIRPLATCSVWVAIDPVTVENGAMRYIPGSHREQRLFGHAMSERTDLALNRVLDSACYDPAKARYDELEPGQFSLHDVFLVHGSAANRSGRRRAGFVMRYMPGTSHFDRELKIAEVANAVRTKFAERPIYLMRGRDHTGKTNMIDLST